MGMASRVAPLVFLSTLALLAGCSNAAGDGGDEGMSETGDASSADETGDTGPAPGTFDEHLAQCEAPILCSGLSWQSYAPPNEPSLPSASAYACALGALRDRTPALLVTSSGCEGMCSGSMYLIRPDGTALKQGWYEAFEGGYDLDGFAVEFSDWAGSGQLCTLQEAGFYDTCDSSYEGDCDYPSEWFVECTSSAEMDCGLEG